MGEQLTIMIQRSSAAYIQLTFPLNWLCVCVTMCITTLAFVGLVSLVITPEAQAFIAPLAR